MQKALKRLQVSYYWPARDRAEAYHVRTCVSCQCGKHGNQREQGLTQPLPTPDRLWQGISHDFLTWLPITEEGHDCSIGGVSPEQNAPRCATHTTASVEDSAELFFNAYTSCLQATCQTVTPSSRATFQKALFKLTGASLGKSTACHPQMNGHAQRANRTV
jgi:hypothetical protein